MTFVPEGSIVGLGARVHLFVNPADRERFMSLFRDILECAVVERDFGMRYPILLVPFSDGSAFSVEFTEDSLAEFPGDVLDDKDALRGAWIEFRTNDVSALQQRLRDGGIREFRHPGSSHVYFSAPGGQVFRVLDVSYKGP